MIRRQFICCDTYTLFWSRLVTTHLGEYLQVDVLHLEEPPAIDLVGLLAHLPHHVPEHGVGASCLYVVVTYIVDHAMIFKFSLWEEPRGVSIGLVYCVVK